MPALHVSIFVYPTLSHSLTLSPTASRWMQGLQMMPLGSMVKGRLLESSVATYSTPMPIHGFPHVTP